MYYIYFNHKGLEISTESNLDLLLKEMSSKIDFCRENGLTAGFYKDLYNINLKNFNNTFINYICSNNNYRDFCTLTIRYIDENIIYPQNTKTGLYKEPENYQNWFLTMCDNDSVSAFFSLSNDDVFEEQLYTINNREILHYKNLEDLIKQISIDTEFNSIEDVFRKIQKEYTGRVIIMPSARTSARQLSVSIKIFNNIYSAVEGLIKVILPINSNTLTKQISKKFQAETSFRISPESRKTSEHPKYKRLRTYSIDGNKFLFLNHVKIGNDIRIHYYIHNNIMYIGYCGRHIPTSDFDN